MSLREKWKNDKFRKRQKAKEKWKKAFFRCYGYQYFEEKNPVFERRKMKKLEDSVDALIFGDTPRVKKQKEKKVII